MTSSKNIFIVRHGHAEFSGHTDFERKLKSKGIENVNNTAHFIQKQCKLNTIKLELCISSAALRTKQTAEIICNHNNLNHQLYCPELYSTSVSNWLEVIAQYTDENIIIVGHNPTFSQMINILCGKDIYLKPAECAFINLEIKEDGIIYPASLLELHINEKQ